MEIWIVISTVCFQIAQYKMYGDMYIPIEPKEKCVQIATKYEVPIDEGMESLPIVKPGDEVYKVCTKVSSKIKAR